MFASDQIVFRYHLKGIEDLSEVGATVEVGRRAKCSLIAKRALEQTGIKGASTIMRGGNGVEIDPKWTMYDLALALGKENGSTLALNNELIEIEIQAKA